MPLVTISGNATATATLGVTAASFTINDGTTVYSAAPTVTISGGGQLVARGTGYLSGVLGGLVVTGTGVVNKCPDGTFCDQVVEGDDLGLDEPALEIGVDDTRCGGCGGPRLDRPRAHLIRPSCKKVHQVEGMVARLDDARHGTQGLDLMGHRVAAD